MNRWNEADILLLKQIVQKNETKEAAWEEASRVLSRSAVACAFKYRELTKGVKENRLTSKEPVGKGLLGNFIANLAKADIPIKRVVMTNTTITIET